MCFADDSRPPIAPIAGGATDTKEFKLTASDGVKSMAYGARATAPSGAGMVVIPDVRGLHQYYKELAIRFAEAGVDAVTIDFFARTAPSDDRSEKFEFMPQVGLTTPETLQADIAAAAAYLQTPEGGHARSVFVVGFCFGGALAYLQAASGIGAAGVIGFYGWPLGLKRWPDRPKPVDAAPQFKAPVLSIYGGADEGIPPDAIKEFDDALKKAGVAHEQHVYPGAPHSFFDRKQTEFADASADAWKHVKDFIARNTKK